MRPAEPGLSCSAALLPVLAGSISRGSRISGLPIAGPASVWLSLLRTETVWRPAADDRFRHSCDEQLRLVLRSPARIRILVCERRDYDGAVLRVDDAHIVAHAIE